MHPRYRTQPELQPIGWLAMPGDRQLRLSMYRSFVVNTTTYRSAIDGVLRKTSRYEPISRLESTIDRRMTDDTERNPRRLSTAMPTTVFAPNVQFSLAVNCNQLY